MRRSRRNRLSREPAELDIKTFMNLMVILVPFLLDGLLKDRSLRQPDFIHPTAEGYTVVVETLYPYVIEAIQRFESRD